MNQGSLENLLLMGACLSLIGLGISGVLVSRSQASSDRRSKRLAAILTPHLRSTQIETQRVHAAGGQRSTLDGRHARQDLRLRPRAPGTLSGKMVCRPGGHVPDRARRPLCCPESTRPAVMGGAAGCLGYL